MGLNSLVDSIITFGEVLPWSTLMTAVISASAALFGVDLSNKASERRLALQFELDAKSRARALKGQKLEELYSLTKEFKDHIKSAFDGLIPVVQAGITNSELNERKKRYLLIGNKNYQRMSVLHNLYFQDTYFTSVFSDFITAQEDVLSFIDIERWEIKHGASGTDLNDAIRVVLEKAELLDDAIREYSIELM
ncbi:hypothetical protein SHEWT2_00922 [Shewanella hafniensis]|nr:hypothetical protein SHEWT2_00922 [Shewanella hafniensis]